MDYECVDYFVNEAIDSYKFPPHNRYDTLCYKLNLTGGSLLIQRCHRRPRRRRRRGRRAWMWCDR